MDIYGIYNLKREYLDFDYDNYYKNLCNKIKEASNIENLKKEEHQKLNKIFDIKIDENELKENFINILKDKDSSKYLWLLYSKYNGEESYLEEISDILKKENQVVRFGINLYKANGWLTHTLYVYQIVNYNIAKNIELINFDKQRNIKNEINELHNFYITLSDEGKFILKIFSLIHDIGVIENVQFHDQIGYKYVSKVLKEIKISDEVLINENLNIKFDELKRILEELIKYHTLMALLSGEKSDDCVEESYKNMLNNIPDINVKNEIHKILFILTFADIIGVNELLMDFEKYNRLKNTYIFLEEIINNKMHNRDKENVAIERICDIAGNITIKELSKNLDNILNKYKIEKNNFLKDMYDIRWFKYTSPLMKTLNDVELTIRVFNALFEMLKSNEGCKILKEYIITFVPSKPTIEYEFIEVFKNEDFFEGMKLASNNSKNTIIYKNISIERKIDEFGKNLSISIID